MRLYISKKRDTRLYIDDILDASDAIESFTDSMSVRLSLVYYSSAIEAHKIASLRIF